MSDARVNRLRNTQALFLESVAAHDDFLATRDMSRVFSKTQTNQSQRGTGMGGAVGLFG